MRRLLTSLPIALLIIMALILPASVSAGNLLPSEFTHANGQVINSGLVLHMQLPADNATMLPEGLTLVKGTPFITPTEVNKGEQVAVRVKATNNGQMQINYALTLTLNGKTAGTPKQLALDPAATQDVVFLAAAQDSGPIDVRVGNLQGILTVKEGSIFDTLPLYLWIFFGVILLVVVLLVVLMVMKPKKRPGMQLDKGKKPLKTKGRPGGPESQMPGGPMQRPGMPNMPEGMLFGSPGQGQASSPQDMSMPGMQQQFQQQQPGMQPQFQQPGMQQPGMQPGMQQQFQPQQPGMQPQFQQQGGMQQQFQPQQPGMQPPSPQGMQQPPMRGPQYPPPPQMPHGGLQQPPPPMQGMPPGMQHGAPPQQGMPFGMQQPQPPMQHGMQGPPPPGMPPMHAPGQPSMQPPMPPGMHGAPPGMQPQMPGAYQSMGMPKFSVSNLTITPNKVKVGEQVSISIIVSNNGAQQGKYSVVLRIGGVVENITDLTLPPGASQTASFTVVKDAPGDYYADIDGLGGFFTVIPLTPPSFTVTTFSVGPERVRQGQPITVTASVINTGELTGSHSLILRVKGIAESQRDIVLGPGKTENVEFQIVKDTPGFYPVSLENWTGKFVVEMDWNG